MSETYEALKAPFDQTYTRNVGGVELTYLTGEQVISRLNEVLGFDGWAFETGDPVIVGDQIYIKGTLRVRTADDMIYHVVKDAFGGAQIKHSRSSGDMIDLGNDIKSAATDALKKAASLIGIGLYLSAKNAEAPRGTSVPSNNRNGFTAVSNQCADCGEELTETRFKDGNVWSPQQLANMGTKKFGRALCMTHYRQAKAQPTQADALVSLPY